MNKDIYKTRKGRESQLLALWGHKTRKGRESQLLALGARIRPLIYRNIVDGYYMARKAQSSSHHHNYSRDALILIRPGLRLGTNCHDLVLETCFYQRLACIPRPTSKSCRHVCKTCISLFYWAFKGSKFEL